MALKTKEEQLTDLSASIARLEATKARIESLGLESMSGGGITRNFMNYGVICKQLNKLIARYNALDDNKPLKNVKKGRVINE